MPNTYYSDVSAGNDLHHFVGETAKGLNSKSYVLNVLCYIWPKMIQFFYMAEAYGSGQRISIVSADVDDSGPGYGLN